MTDPKALAEEIIQLWYDAISPDLRKRIGVEEGKARIAARLAAFADEVRKETDFQYNAALDVLRNGPAAQDESIDACYNDPRVQAIKACYEQWRREERHRADFREGQLTEALKAYMYKYGPGYSSTDSLAYDNARGVLDGLAHPATGKGE